MLVRMPKLFEVGQEPVHADPIDEAVLLGEQIDGFEHQDADVVFLGEFGLEEGDHGLEAAVLGEDFVEVQ